MDTPRLEFEPGGRLCFEFILYIPHVRKMESERESPTQSPEQAQVSCLTQLQAESSG